MPKRRLKALALSMLLVFSGTNAVPPAFAGTETKQAVKDKQKKEKKKKAEQKKTEDAEFGKGFQGGGFEPSQGFQKDMNKAQKKSKKAKKKK